MAHDLTKAVFEIYTMNPCPDCAGAKALIASNKLACKKEHTQFTRAELESVVGPVRTLPQIIFTDSVSGQRYHVGGFKDLRALIAGTHEPRLLS